MRSGAEMTDAIADSGAARSIANALMSIVGVRFILVAMALTGLIVGIPLFYNVGFVLVIPLIFSVVYRYNFPAVYIGNHHPQPAELGHLLHHRSRLRVDAAEHDEIGIAALDVRQDRLEVGVFVGGVLARHDLRSRRLHRSCEGVRKPLTVGGAVVDHRDRDRRRADGPEDDPDAARVRAHPAAAQHRVLRAAGNVANQIAGLINKLMTLGIIWWGAHLVIDGNITVGQLIAFNMLAGRVSGPVLKLVQLWQEFQQAGISIARLGEQAPIQPADDGELFWGNDRLEQALEWAKRGAKS